MTATTPRWTSEAGDEAACFTLARERSDCEVVSRFTIPGEPMSKARARFTKRGSQIQAYTPERTKQAEQTVAWMFRQATPGWTANSEIGFGVFAIFFNGTYQRRDVDNMVKLILDGLNKIVWQDDSQVEEISARRGNDIPQNARTEVLIYRVGKATKPQGVCDHCGKKYDTYESWRGKRRFCSAECRSAFTVQAKTRICQHCGTTFISHHVLSAPKFCSKECHYASQRRRLTCDECDAAFTKQSSGVRATNHCSAECRDTAARKRRAKNAKGPCLTCDGFVTKKSYKQCMACRQAGRRVSGNPQPVEGGA